MTDEELAKAIRGKVEELNVLLREAAKREILVEIDSKPRRFRYTGSDREYIDQTIYDVNITKII